MVRRFLREHDDREHGTDHDCPRNISAAQNQSSIAATFAGIDPDNWKAIVTLLAESTRVGIVGLRQSVPAADLLAYPLGLIGESIVRVSSHGTSMDVDALCLLGHEDCLFAISTYPCTKATVDATLWARGNGSP